MSDFDVNPLTQIKTQKMRELLLTTIPAAVLSALTFLFARKEYKAKIKQQNAQAETLEIDNIDKVAKIWRQLSEDLQREFTIKLESLKKDYNETKEELSIVKQQYAIVLQENKGLHDQMQSLERELKASRTQIKTLTDQNKSLLQELRKSNKNYEEVN